MKIKKFFVVIAFFLATNSWSKGNYSRYFAPKNVLFFGSAAFAAFGGYKLYATRAKAYERAYKYVNAFNIVEKFGQQKLNIGSLDWTRSNEAKIKIDEFKEKLKNFFNEEPDQLFNLLSEKEKEEINKFSEAIL